MKPKNLFLIFIFGLFIFLLPSVVEGYCKMSCWWQISPDDCRYGAMQDAVEKLGIIGFVERYTPYEGRFVWYHSCSDTSGKCSESRFLTGNNGQSCTAIDGCLPFPSPSCKDCLKTGVWDASQSQCVSCNGKTEQYIRGDTFEIYAGCAGFPSSCSNEGNPGDGKCESACGADDECDEKAPNSTVSGGICNSDCKFIPKEPDLIITDIWLDGNIIKYTIKNQGEVGAGESRSYLYIDGNQVNSDPVSNLASGQSSNESFVYYDYTCSNNSETIEVCADKAGPNGAAASNGWIPESDENNNCLKVTWLPDLIISTHRYSPSSPNAGDAISFTGKVKNQGLCPADWSYTRLYIDKDNDKDYDYTYDQTTYALDPGETEGEEWNGVWKCTKGTHKYQICADATGRVTESKERNNCVSQTFTCEEEGNGGEETATLFVRSTPYDGASITGSPSGFSGTTNYTKENISPGTSISLEAVDNYTVTETIWTKHGPVRRQKTYYFKNWSGCKESDSNEITFSMPSGDTICTANYDIKYTLSVSKTGSGTVTGTGIDCGTDCSEKYFPGTSVKLTASPKSGWQFAGWSGACSGTGSCTVTMNGNKSVTASFTVPTFTLKVESTPYNGASITLSLIHI